MNEYEYRTARLAIIALASFLCCLSATFIITGYMDTTAKIEACLKNPQFGFCNDISGRSK